MNNEIKSDIIIYKDINGEIKLDVSLENDTVWLSQKQMEMFFDRDKSVISRHIKNIFKEGELDKKSVVAKNATTAVNGGVKINDNAIVSLSLMTAKSNRDKSDSKYLGGIDG